MRIIAGAWKGRALAAPPGLATRPTAQRARQALFDMILHAPWGGREVLEGATVLDAFAGTGALGLEALSRGAADVTFFETDPAALRILRANIAACGAGGRARVVARDVLKPGPGVAKSLIFLDPPYDKGLVQRSINVLRAEGWVRPGSLVVTETSRLDQVVETGSILASRVYGAAQLLVWRESPHDLAG
jgi:16S rRNA (guanine966-N2)-methyltransferase